MLISHGERGVRKRSRNAGVALRVLLRPAQKEAKPVERPGRMSERFFIFRMQPLNRRRSANPFCIASPRHKRPRFLARICQEARDVPVGAAELERLQNLGLHLRAGIALRELRRKIHPVHAALSGDRGE
jgi:hypothetical protein